MLLLILPSLASLSVLGTVLFCFFPKTPFLFAALLFFATAYGVLSFKRPRAGLLALCFFLPLFNSVLFSRHLRFFPPTALLFLAFFLGWLLHRIARKDLTRLSTPLNAPLSAYFALGLGSGLITLLRYAQFYPFVGRSFRLAAINRLDENSLQAVIHVFLVTVVFISGPALFWSVLHVLKNRRDIARMLAALAAGVALSVLFGIYQSFGHETLGNDRYAQLRRINATFMDSNGLGIFFGLALPPIAALVFFTRSWFARRGGLLLLVAALYVLSLSGSRTGMLCLLIAAAVAALVFLVRDKSTAGKRAAFYLQPALVLLVLAIAFFPVGSRPPDSNATILGERMANSLQRVSAQGLWSLLQTDRWPMWHRAVFVTSRFPVCGIGLGAYWLEIPNFLEWDPRGTFLRDSANSHFLQASAEMGIIGLFLLLVVLGIIARQCFRLALRPGHDPPGRALAAALCGALCGIILMFTTGQHTDFMEIQGLFWLLTGMVFAWSYRLEPEERPAGIVSRAGSRRAFEAVCAGLVVLGLAGQTANALTILSLPERRKACGLDASEGFYPWETSGGGALCRWTTGEAWSMVEPGGPFLQFYLYVYHPDAAQNPVTVDLLLDGKFVRKEVFDRPGESRRVCVPVPELNKAKMEVRLRVSRVWRPAGTLPGNTDTRKLGVLVSEFKSVRNNNP